MKETSRTDPSEAVAPSAEMEGGEGVRRGTGRDRPEWFTLLDEWGAPGRPYREIADWLTGEHRLSNWWAQKLIVEYEQARGLRDPGVRPDGTFQVTASKSVAVPAERAFAAFVDDEARRKWLPKVALHERTRNDGRSARFDWEDGATRLAVTVAASGPDRSQVAVRHERLPGLDSADRMKAFWRERLNELRALLEA